METVGVRELRQNLSVYLRAIQDRGEPIEVTDRGHPVAVLAPLRASDDDYDALEAAGRLRPAEADWTTFDAPTGPVTTAGTEALEELREDRL
jgi:prevent-host-death family protein